MKRHRGFLLGVVAAGLFGGVLPSALGSCAGPQLEIVNPPAQGDRPARLIVDESVSAKGLYWIIGCDDTGGDSGCGEDAEPQRSYQNIEVRIIGPVTKKLERQYRHRRGLDGVRFSRLVGERDANAGGSFRLSFAVPKLPTGRYFLMGSEIGDPELVHIAPADSRSP